MGNPRCLTVSEPRQINYIFFGNVHVLYMYFYISIQTRLLQFTFLTHTNIFFQNTTAMHLFQSEVALMEIFMCIDGATTRKQIPVRNSGMLDAVVMETVFQQENIAVNRVVSI